MIFRFIFVYDLSPALFGVFKEGVNVDIVHQLLPDNGHHVGKCPFAFEAAPYEGYQQVGKHGRPYLYLNGILIVAQEIFQWEVLL